MKFSESRETRIAADYKCDDELTIIVVISEYRKINCTNPIPPICIYRKWTINMRKFLRGFVA